MSGIYFPPGIVPEKNTKPSNLEYIYYIFWKKGISYDEFNKLPVPYIFMIMKCYMYEIEQKKKDAEKAKKGGKKGM